MAKLRIIKQRAPEGSSTPPAYNQKYAIMHNSWDIAGTKATKNSQVQAKMVKYRYVQMCAESSTANSFPLTFPITLLKDWDSCWGCQLLIY